VLLLRGAAQIVLSKRRICTDDQEIITFIETLVTRSRRQDGSVSGLELEDAAPGSAEAHRRVAAGDSKHLMNLRVVVDIIEDSVAP
jgi:hypothetical protein